MPGTRRRSSTVISKETIDAANTALQQLPEKPKENLSLREAVAALSDTIKTALDRGYSYEEVAGMLGNQGVKISPASLKSYLAATQKPGKTTKRRGRTTKAEAQAAVPPVETPIEEAPKHRPGRKPKATTPEAEPTPEAPTPRKRSPRAKTAEAPTTADKRTTSTKKTVDKTSEKKSIRSTTGRHKKAV